ncbi:MAG: SMP-30/gluconolactonase/LRE family protein [Ktedonobacteraceae bacterium]|nr:SMP-30/gluconolactonase/LRE family protein [Ktedonobacteraceae bacterium]
MKKRLHLILPCILLFTLTLAACGQSPASTEVPIDTSASDARTTAAVSASGLFHEYSLPQNGSGMMRPAIDAEGRIWFGEMGHNYLAVFDPRTQTFQQMIPPRGASGVMGVAVAKDDTIWFAEQYANYIGHYTPRTGQYNTYDLPMLKRPDPSNKNNTLILPSAPNDIALDAHGNVWFTELNADSLGMLDARTGQMKHYPLTAQGNTHDLDPYGIALDPYGMVWFTEANTNNIGQLDPSTGAVHRFTLQGSSTSFMEIASDSQGTIWATSFSPGLLVKLNPATGAFTTYNAPSTGNNSGALYGLDVTPNGEIWVTIPAEGIIARLDASNERFIYYHIPTPASLPFGVVMGMHNTLWFTEAGSDKVGVLQP